jgi:hypothetical protein
MQIFERLGDNGVAIHNFKDLGAAFASVDSLIGKQDYEAARLRLRSIIAGISLESGAMLVGNVMGRPHPMKAAFDGLVQGFELGATRNQWDGFDGAKRRLLAVANDRVASQNVR